MIANSNAAAGNDPIRVLYVELNLDGTIGGSYFSLLYLVAGLKRNNFCPIVYFASPNSLVSRFQSENIETHVLVPRVPFRKTVKLFRPFVRGLNFITAHANNIGSVFKYRRILRLHNIDLLHLNNSINKGHAWMIAARLSQVPCLTHERGLPERYSLGAHLLGPGLSAVICISKAVRDNILKKGPKGLITHIVHNGLDPPKLQATKSPAEIRSEFGIEQCSRLIGIVGNIQRWKGQDIVVRAMAQLLPDHQDLICLLIGDVSKQVSDDLDFYSHLQTLLCQYNLQQRVILVGFRSDVANYVNALEVLIHASVNPEPFGRVLLEAMALRKPVIAAKAGGVEEIVIHGSTGLTYPPGDWRALTSHLRSLLGDSEARSAMGAAGFARLVSHFSARQNVLATEDIYRSIIESHR